MSLRLFDLPALVDHLFTALFERGLDDCWLAAWPLDDL